MQLHRPHLPAARLVSLTAYAYTNGRFFWLTEGVPVTRKGRKLSAARRYLYTGTVNA